MDTFTNAAIWILIIEIFSISIYPALSLYFKGLSDRGFALSKVLGILIAGYIVWVLSSLHIFAFSRLESAIVSFLTIFAFISISFIHIKLREKIINRMIKDRALNIEEEPLTAAEKPLETEINEIALNTPKDNFISKIQNNKHFKMLEEKFIQNEEFTSSKELVHINKLILVEEILFILAFFVWVYIRGINPDIFGTEKFMDFGIMNAILKSSYFPPHDMWLSGFQLNYYYYGQYMYAFLTQLSGLSSNFTYNFSIASIFAFCFILAFSLVHTLTRKYIPALISASIMLLGGNIDYIQHWLTYLFTNHSLNGFSFWYPSSTRMIPFTINEFPIYSFVVSDLHAHVTNIPVVLASLIITVNIFLRRKFGLIDFVLSGFILGIMAVTNSWDAIFYASLICIVILYVRLITKEDLHAIDNLSGKGKVIYFIEKIKGIEYKSFVEFMNLSFFEGIIIAVASGVLGILLFIPFYFNFKAPVDGIGINIYAHSNPLTLLVLFGFFLFFIVSFIAFLFYIIFSHKKLQATDFIVTMFIILGVILVVTPELFFLEDIFHKANPPYFRANTVFKLYYQAWILFSITVGYIISRVNNIRRLKDIKKFIKPLVWVWNILVVLFLLSAFAYTYQALNEGYFNVSNNKLTCSSICFNQFKTDDGTAYIKTLHPDDMAMINWLNTNAAPDSTIVEAVGDSYTYYARISANTGLATVLGWPNHEYQWRNTYSYSDVRSRDVFNLYNSGTLINAENIIKKYKIDYIIVGDQERLKYPAMNEIVLHELGDTIFQSGNSYIIKTQK